MTSRRGLQVRESLKRVPEARVARNSVRIAPSQSRPPVSSSITSRKVVLVNAQRVRLANDFDVINVTEHAMPVMHRIIRV